jgi:hypothetical protein
VKFAKNRPVTSDGVERGGGGRISYIIGLHIGKTVILLGFLREKGHRIKAFSPLLFIFIKLVYANCNKLVSCFHLFDTLLRWFCLTWIPKVSPSPPISTVLQKCLFALVNFKTNHKSTKKKYSALGLSQSTMFLKLIHHFQTCTKNTSCNNRFVGSRYRLESWNWSIYWFKEFNVSV